MAETTTPKKTESGLEPNIAGALSYVLGFVTGIIFLLVEKNNKFVKFHAMQSILFSGVIIALNIILSVILIPILFTGLSGFAFLSLLSGGLTITVFVLWIVLIIKAYQNQEWELPVIGKIAKDYANK